MVRKDLIEYPVHIQKAYAAISLLYNYDMLNPSGGSLHIVLEDGNYDCAKHCIEYAKERGDIIGELIATLLADLTEDQVEQVCERSYEITQLVEYGQEI